MEVIQEDTSIKKGKEQLDLLLLKAESYTRFIEANQKRSQDIFLAKNTIASATKPSSSTPNDKKRGAGSELGSGKKKSKGESPTTVATVEEGPAFAQPPNLTGGQLMGHQIEGLMWLLSLWENGLNGILADEMGLGKTIQIIALIAHLRHHKTAGPYLIIGPLATLGNWLKEFQKWLPDCPVLLYHGDKAEREQMRRQKMPAHSQKSLDFPVVITSFEICMGDKAFLEKYTWQYLIMDEGHRLKNRKCKLFRDLKSLQSISRLLLTGTPIQNSLDELWSLLNFCSPMIFDDLEVFQSWFGFRNIGQETKVEDIIDEEEKDRVVTKLHDILRPFVLRRMKKDVLKGQIMDKKEVIVYCGMSLLQAEYYARVCDNSIRDFLLGMGLDKKSIGNQLNLLMNQRKACNHPFLFGDIPDSDGKPIQENDPAALITSSGKFKLLHRILPRLKEEGRKVILFSQFTGILDLIEDYLHYMQFEFFRLDGQTKLAERQESIDEFNSPSSNVFIFLLSTRAGGLGVNLTAADTAILFDSDWNPHADSQAQDRCHRIGQKNNVVVYRFLTTNSVDIEMIKRQVSKKKLERLTIHGGDFRSVGRRRSGEFTVKDLKRLLEDDVRSLHREAGSSSSADDLHKDISEEELDLIMDRDRLFAGVESGDSFSNEGEMFDVIADVGESLLMTIE